jgi:rod shape-determining protein MreC
MPPARQQRSGAGALLIALGIIVLLVLIQAVGLLRPVKSLIGLATSPVTGIFRPGKSEIEKENQALRDQVSNLTAEVSKREEAKRQNDALRAELNFAQSNDYKEVQADIISQDPTNYQQFFTINRGSGNGVSKGMVVVSQGLLIGRIIDTTINTAKVYLITDYNSAVPAITQQGRATGVVRGQRGFGLELQMVPQTEPLQANDTVITSGFGGDYPRGLVIGTLGDIHQKDAEVYQSAVIHAAVDFRKIDSVFIITGNK